MSLGKGLGTSSSQEAKEYFSNLPLHVMDFSWEGAESGEVIQMRPDKLQLPSLSTQYYKHLLC
jgi:DNA topoisomerase-2